MTHKLKILVIPSWFPTDQDKNAGVFVMEQARLLADHGLQVSVFIIETTGFSPLLRKSKVKHELNEGIVIYKAINKTVPKIGKKLTSLWAHLYEDLYDKYAQQNGSPDIIHAHGYIAGFAARGLAAKHQVPFVITEHNSSILKKSYRPWHKNEIIKTYNEASEIIAVGENLKRSMETLTNNPIHVIPNLVDNQVFFPEKRTQNDLFEFTAVGGLDKLKRIDRTIEAFALFLKTSKRNNAKLTIIGDGSEMNNLKALAGRLEILKKVQFTGPLSLLEVAIRMRKANALITVSAFETFGKVIIEALASGTPVLAAESADPEKIITDGKNGVKVSSDLIGLPQAMLRMVELSQAINPNELHNDVVKKYGKDAVLKQIISVYQKAMINSKRETNSS